MTIGGSPIDIKPALDFTITVSRDAKNGRLFRANCEPVGDTLLVLAKMYDKSVEGARVKMFLDTQAGWTRFGGQQRFSGGPEFLYSYEFPTDADADAYLQNLMAEAPEYLAP